MGRGTLCRDVGRSWHLAGRELGDSSLEPHAPLSRTLSSTRSQRLRKPVATVQMGQSLGHKENRVEEGRAVTRRQPTLNPHATPRWDMEPRLVTPNLRPSGPLGNNGSSLDAATASVSPICDSSGYFGEHFCLSLCPLASRGYSDSSLLS